MTAGRSGLFLFGNDYDRVSNGKIPDGRRESEEGDPTAVPKAKRVALFIPRRPVKRILLGWHS